MDSSSVELRWISDDVAVSIGAREDGDEDMITSELSPCVDSATSVVERDEVSSVLDVDVLLIICSVIAKLDINGPCVEVSE